MARSFSSFFLSFSRLFFIFSVAKKGDRANIVSMKGCCLNERLLIPKRRRGQTTEKVCHIPHAGEKAFCRYIERAGALRRRFVRDIDTVKLSVRTFRRREQRIVNNRCNMCRFEYSNWHLIFRRKRTPIQFIHCLCHVGGCERFFRPLMSSIDKFSSRNY